MTEPVLEKKPRRFTAQQLRRLLNLITAEDLTHVGSDDLIAVRDGEMAALIGRVAAECEVRARKFAGRP